MILYVRHGRATILSCPLVLALAACGTTTEDRAVSGAGIGAAGGAILGAVTGLSVVEGALLGTGVGALGGVFTDPDKVNFGDPIWKRGQSQAPAPTPTSAPASGPVSQNLVKQIQSDLAEAGYDPGPIDGVMGPKTKSAIRRYQQEHGLLIDGRPSEELALHIQNNSSN